MTRYLLWTVAAAAAFAAFAFLVAISPLGDAPERGADAVPPGAVGHPDPYPAPDFTLVDHRGEERALEDFQGRWLALFFGFTHCPDVCPITLGTLTTALEGLGEEADRMAVALVSVDPERDTPERLAQYLEPFHPSIVGLTGKRGTLEEVAAEYGIYAQRFEEEGDAPDAAGGHATGGEHSPGAAPGEPHAEHLDDVPGAGEGYMVDHSSLILMVDPDGRIVTSFAPFTPADELEEGMRFLLENH